MIQEPGEGKQPITLKTDEIYLLDNEFGQLGIGNNLTYFMIDLYICEQKHHFAIVTQKIYSLEGDKYTEDLV